MSFRKWIPSSPGSWSPGLWSPRPENPTIAIFEAKSALKRLNHALFWHNSFQQSIKNKNTTVLRKKHLSQKRKDSLYWKKGTIPPFNAEPVRLGLMRSL